MKRAVVLALACTVVCVPAASAATKARTTLTIDAVFLSAGQTHWSGDLSSKRKACKNKRRVLIYRERPGADLKVGSTKSFAGMVAGGWFWSYSQDGAAPTGSYYALVKPTKVCKGARSKSMAGPA